MGRKPSEPEATLPNHLILLLACFISCGLVYVFASAVLTTGGNDSFSEVRSLALVEDGADNRGCCRGIENLELWGAAVKWGSEFKFNNSQDCCDACKSMCTGKDGPCLCDTWVFCGNREACGSKFGESQNQVLNLNDCDENNPVCWLKKQKDSLTPERQDAGEKVSWTSGLIFGKGEDSSSHTGLHAGPERTFPNIGDSSCFLNGWLYNFIDFYTLGKSRDDMYLSVLIIMVDVVHLKLHMGIVELETQYGSLRVKLFPDCAPHSVTYILDLLALRHCAGCQFYRAESRGQSWDSEGNHIKNAPFGPPFGLIQGTLEALGNPFKKIPVEDCPTIRRGSIAWVDSGPEFFISLANHGEWKRRYTVFGSVLPEDMSIAEKIAALPTVSDVWNNINVSVLEKPVPLLVRRIQKSHADIITNANSD
ncbi:Cyclophilin-like domain containing protein [Senna tora]|uniref:Cyclophilin-like domain containing protein n=1 Tax=Senna tora TaxID=362788 RepID=A0A834TU20_9FABA|nr:Cyclophilin-like domain containing protein [Senna tora]